MRRTRDSSGGASYPRISAVFAALLGTSMSCERQMPPVTVVQDLADASRAIGRMVELRGRASDAKLSGTVRNDVFSLYCLNISSWPADLVDQVVTVRGVLEYSDEFSSRDPMTQGLRGGPV